MNIDQNVLSDKIAELTNLQSELDGIDVTAAASTSGQGANFEMIQMIDAMYLEIKTSLSTLISSTAAYLTNVYDDAETAEDACAARAEELGG